MQQSRRYLIQDRPPPLQIISRVERRHSRFALAYHRSVFAETKLGFRVGSACGNEHGKVGRESPAEWQQENLSR